MGSNGTAMMTRDDYLNYCNIIFLGGEKPETPVEKPPYPDQSRGAGVIKKSVNLIFFKRNF